MAKYGYRDGKLITKDIVVKNAPEFLELDGNNIIVVVNGVERKIVTNRI